MLIMYMQICDFGLAKWRQYSTTKTNSRSQRGTVTHIPPENWRDINTTRSPKFDVYGFGIMLWELLSEQVPFTGPDGRQGSLLYIHLYFVIETAKTNQIIKQNTDKNNNAKNNTSNNS